MTKYSRVLKYSHRVEIFPVRGHLVVDWKNFFGQHNYIVAEDLEDLDILATELVQAINNYKRKKLMHK